MSCWCDSLNYICTDCEAKQKWFKEMDFADKQKLLRYRTLVEQEDVSQEFIELFEWKEVNGFELTDIPTGV